MFCPECSCEYRDGFYQCADCNVALVPTPPIKEQKDVAQEEPALITLARFDLAMAAEQAKAALESKGIPAFALDSATIGMNPMLSWAAGGVRLQVPAMHATEARAFLNESGFLQVEEKPDFNQCPRCGSTAIKNHGRTKLEVILSVLVLGALLLFLKRAHTCRSCGHEWRA